MICTVASCRSRRAPRRRRGAARHAEGGIVTDMSELPETPSFPQLGDVRLEAKSARGARRLLRLAPVPLASAIYSPMVNCSCRQAS
jgi:hypothetical protein